MYVTYVHSKIEAYQNVTPERNAYLLMRVFVKGTFLAHAAGSSNVTVGNL